MGFPRVGKVEPGKGVWERPGRGDWEAGGKGWERGSGGRKGVIWGFGGSEKGCFIEGTGAPPRSNSSDLALKRRNPAPWAWFLRNR